MLKQALQHFDQTIRTNTLLLFMATFFMAGVNLLTNSNILFLCGYSILASFVVFRLSTKRFFSLKSALISFLFVFLFTYFLGICFFYVDYFVLKNFIDFYTATYLPDAEVNLCVVFVFSVLNVLILPFWMPLLNLDFGSIALCRVCYKELLCQVLICSAVTLLFFKLNSIPTHSVELFTVALVAKSFLAIVLIYFLISYLEVISRKQGVNEAQSSAT